MPNIDAVHYFIESIWPHIRSKLPDVTFRIVGSNIPEELIKHDGRDNIIVDGYVKDLDAYFNKIRITVAPLRYGAGIKGKVAVSLSHGVPCIATTIAAEGMNLIHGDNILVCDKATDMAESVVQLYQNPDLWNSLSENGIKFVNDNYSRELGDKIVSRILNMAIKKNNKTII